MKIFREYISGISIILSIGTTYLFQFVLSAEISFSGLDYLGVPFDHKLLERMNATHGIFVEVGAHDGIMQSNTKLLEDYYGWTGILVEPSEVLFKRLCNNRPNSQCFQCALGSFEQNNTYIYGDFDGSLMSSVDGKRENNRPTQRVQIRSLQSVLTEVGLQHINFFSLDTEGFELQVLEGIDFNKTVFDYLLIEIYTPQFNEIISFLLSNGYIMIENFSNYSHLTHSGWDGTHNDYLFINSSLIPASSN